MILDALYDTTPKGFLSPPGLKPANTFHVLGKCIKLWRHTNYCSTAGQNKTKGFDCKTTKYHRWLHINFCKKKKKKRKLFIFWTFFLRLKLFTNHYIPCIFTYIQNSLIPFYEAGFCVVTVHIYHCAKIHRLGATVDSGSCRGCCGDGSKGVDEADGSEVTPQAACLFLCYFM